MTRAILLYATLACALTRGSLIAAEPADDALRQQVTELLSRRRDELGIPGMTAAVVRNGRLAFTIALGLADAEYNVAATPDTVFRIGGITKPLTAVAVLDLVHQGKLTLDASLRDYVPELPDKGHAITIEQVLAHLAGLRRERSAEEWRSRTNYPTLLASIEPFAKDPLVTEPGGRFIFTNYGYTLLGLVVERVGSQPFDIQMQRSLFAPLGMTSTGVDTPATVQPRRARGYVRKDGALSHAAFVDLSARAPGSGLVSTSPDLAAFVIALFEGRILSDQLRTRMLTGARTREGASTQYGLGWFVREDAGRRIVGHSGPEVGFSSFLVAWPDEKAAVIILSNLEGVNMSRVGLEAGRAVVGVATAEPAATFEEP